MGGVSGCGLLLLLEPDCSFCGHSLPSLLQLLKEGISGNGRLDSFHPFFLLALIGRLDSIVEVVANDNLPVCVGLTRFDHRPSLDLLIQTDLKTVLRRGGRGRGRGIFIIIKAAGIH